MREKIRKFFRLRKQNDTVKLICIFALVAIAAFASVWYHVWEIYVYVDNPAEYVLMGEDTVTNKRVDELRQIEGVERVSRQMDETLHVMFRGVSAEIDCMMLSQQYIEGMFGRKTSDGTKKIYMNEAAFSAWKQALSDKGGNISELGAGGSEFEICYSGAGDVVGSEEKGGTGDVSGDAGSAAPSDDSDSKSTSVFSGDSASAGIQLPKSAKLVVIKGGGVEGEKKGEAGFSCMAETDSRLLKEAYMLRIRFRKHDLDGLQVKGLKDLGYEIQNEGALIEEEYEVKMKLLHIQYGLALCAVCVIAVWVTGRLLRARRIREITIK